MELTVKLGSGYSRVELFGASDSHLKTLRKLTRVELSARGGVLILRGRDKDVKTAAKLIEQMEKHLIEYKSLSNEDIKSFAIEKSGGKGDASGNSIVVYSHHKQIKPATPGQKRYIETMLNKDVTFCTGPAGTGKTYLAVAVAVAMLKKKQIRRIVLARPAVEAGEKLGFLPGDLQAKVNPYLRPLFDALGDMMDFVQMRKFIELDIIEIIPLAFMRGRTLNEAVIICDEAQNTSPMQMLMVLTRLGHGSKMIITGDITQTDLARGQKSGMIEAVEILKRVRGIGCVDLIQGDIVRHRLVQNIVRAYKKKRKS